MTRVRASSRVVDGVAAEEVSEGAEEVVAQEREAGTVRQHEHSEIENRLQFKQETVKNHRINMATARLVRI